MPRVYEEAWLLLLNSFCDGFLMSDTVYTNGFIFHKGKFMQGGFRISNGRFVSVFEGPAKEENAIDLKGQHVIPGLVDIHIHGCFGDDFSDGSTEGILRMSQNLARLGITSFLPTTMTLDEEQYIRIAESLNEAINTAGDNSARILGMRMEGPFLSEARKGAHAPIYLANPNLELFHAVQTVSEGRLRVIDVAPEKDGAMDFIKKASKESVVSLAHTDATYEEALLAFKEGAGHVTHLFNAMRPLRHRDPGIIAALFDSPGITTEIIGDGIHVHESMVRLAFRECRGRICLISDALRCMGEKEGKYNLAGEIITLNGGVARLSDGTIAGAALSVYDTLLNLISMGIAKENAILSATSVPAKVIGNQNIGEIEAGRFADFIVCDAKLNRRSVFLGGLQIS